MAPALFLFGEENRFTLVKGQDKKKKDSALDYQSKGNLPRSTMRFQT